MFRILVNCVIAPRQRKLPYWGLEPDERRLLRWIREAGLRLTAAELVKLAEAGIEPKAQYLGAENRQRVVELIYTKEISSTARWKRRWSFLQRCPAR